jgi:transcriptional regulator with XRE-family HTH domain
MLSATSSIAFGEGVRRTIKAMLDSDEMAKRLRIAIKDAGITGSELARACGVKPQAVSGWKKNGRIAKGHLETVARMTKKSLEYFLGNGRGGKNFHIGDSPIHETVKQVHDVVGFMTVLEAWQEADHFGRQNILAAVRAVRAVNGIKRKRAGGKG